MAKRKPAYPYIEEWELEVPELTEEQEENVADILRQLGKTRKTKDKRQEVHDSEYTLLFPHSLGE